MKICRICAKRKKIVRQYCEDCEKFIADRRQHDQKQQKEMALNFPKESMKVDYFKMKEQGFF